MNHLGLVWQLVPGRENTQTYSLDVRVDGQRLIDLVNTVQQSTTEGAYLGLFDSEQYELACWQDWDTEWLIVLGCACGITECRPLRAKVESGGGQVVWKDFYNPYHNDWNYAALGPFTFEAAQYRAEVDRALREWGQGWSV